MIKKGVSSVFMNCYTKIVLIFVINPLKIMVFVVDFISLNCFTPAIIAVIEVLRDEFVFELL